MSTEKVFPMHVLEYLSDPRCEQKPDDSVRAEYRLLSSGVLHRDMIGDWSKSEVARILLNDPLLLFVASRPFEDHPLELVLHLAVPLVRDEADNFLTSYHPDAEVAKDLAALLSLLCRRLITVAGKTHERHLTTCYRHPLFDGVPLPLPLANAMQRSYWPSRPSIVSTGLNTQRIEDYNPWPKPVDAAKLTKMLLSLPRLAHRKSIVASSRLYALALELIHERPDISYQLLISSVETIASAALSSFQPADEEKVKHKQGVFDLAVSLGLKEDAASKLAIEACKGDYWIMRKFKRFLIENSSDLIWEEQDDLYRIPHKVLIPQRDTFEKTLRNIYNTRSKATHEGRPFPVTATHTGSPYLSSELASTLIRSASSGQMPVFPPVIWFERVVNSAISGFWESAVRDLETLPPANSNDPIPTHPSPGN